MSKNHRNKVISVQHPLQEYIWGENCEGRTVLDETSLCVKQETMPVGTAEQLHYHMKAQQFFFILSGVGCFDIDGEQYTVNQQEGIHIQPGQVHRIQNAGVTPLTFLLVSQPSTNYDRYLSGTDGNV